MDIKANAKRHFQTLAGLHGPIEVPEWGDETEPAKIYFRVINEAQKKAIQEATDKHGTSATVLVLRALDESGSRIWSDMDRIVLENEYDPEVVDRVAVQIIHGDSNTRNKPADTNLSDDHTSKTTDEELKN